MLISGFYCDILGERHRYDTDIVDQINFDQTKEKARITGQPEPYRIWNADGCYKGVVSITYEQFQAVFMAASDWKYEKLYLCHTYKVVLEAAQSIEEIDDIMNGVIW